MNLCSDKHEEVCFESRVCPVCDIREDLEIQIESLEEELKSAEKTIEDLERNNG